MTKSRTRLAATIGMAATAAMAAAALGASPAHAEGTVFGADSDGAIKGSYIVKMSDDQVAAKADKSIASEYGAKLSKTFDHLNAFSVKMSADEAKALAADSAVEYVEQNQEYSITAAQQDPPSWGLDRVDQEETKGDGVYNYPDSAGEGVTAYVIDTGVDYKNADFGDRASSGTDTVDGDDDAMDEHGHGTHVSGTIAGEKYGLAKKANVVGVRVLDAQGSGTTEGVVEGIEWVTENHKGPSVANMSLGGGADQAIDDAVSASIESGVSFAVAAGNETADACEGSPSGVEDAITVAASDDTDTFAEFSNFGKCVDIIAPGVDIVSDAPGGGTETMSGTSMATPHVVGAAALYVGLNPEATPADVKAALVDNALDGVVKEVPEGTANKLLYTGFMLDGAENPGEPANCEAASAKAAKLVDADTVESTLAVGCDAADRSSASVKVDITHSYRGDLQLDLVSPSGESYRLKDADLFDGAADVAETFSVDLADAEVDGDWTLSVTDSYLGDTGTLNSWSVEL